MPVNDCFLIALAFAESWGNLPPSFDPLMGVVLASINFCWFLRFVSKCISIVLKKECEQEEEESHL